MSIVYLSKGEVIRVVRDLKGQSRSRSLGSQQNLVIFWLGVGVGLRRDEAARLEMGFFDWGPDPHLRLPARVVKGKKEARDVPLWINAETGRDLLDWYELRRQHGAGDRDPYLWSYRAARPLTGHQVALRWRTAIRILGPDRVKRLNHHAGRHTFASQCLEAGYSLVVVRDWLGHKSAATTSRYLHAIVKKKGDLYG